MIVYCTWCGRVVPPDCKCEPRAYVEQHDAPTIEQVRGMLLRCAEAPEPRHVWRAVGYLDKIIRERPQ